MWRLWGQSVIVLFQGFGYREAYELEQRSIVGVLYRIVLQERALLKYCIVYLHTDRP